MNYPRRPVLRLLFLFVAGGLLAGCGGSNSQKTMELSGINTGEVLQGLLARTRRAVNKVNSIDSALRVKSDLQRVSEDFDDLLYHIPKLSEEGRVNLAKQSTRALPEMRLLANQIHERPALDDILGVTLDQIVAKLGRVR